MPGRKYGTWVDDNGVRHYISGVQRDNDPFDRRRGKWDSYVFCGNYIDVEPRAPKAVVTCFRCLRKAFHPFDPKSVLRSQKADLVIIDEAQDIDFGKLEEVGIFALIPPTTTGAR